MATASTSSAPQPFVIGPMTQEEEDQVILARITLDERPLRRMIKKFHNYTSLSNTPVVPVVTNGPPTKSAVDDAREAFLLELSSFELMITKSSMICEAETRQVGKYHLERQRLDNEHVTLKTQIEELKSALEHAQMSRRRKIEYDVVAERVNTLPSREELESAIEALENDMAAIRAEHDNQDKTIQCQKSALDSIITDLGSLRFMGKETETASIPQSLRGTPALESVLALPENDVVSVLDSNFTSGNIDDVEEDKNASREATSEGLVSEDAVEDNDIEMGEVEEDPKEKSKRKQREELEEGEASEASSALSDPPDD